MRLCELISEVNMGKIIEFFKTERNDTAPIHVMYFEGNTREEYISALKSAIRYVEEGGLVGFEANEVKID